jgi:hypothetical protein
MMRSLSRARLDRPALRRRKGQPSSIERRSAGRPSGANSTPRYLVPLARQGTRRGRASQMQALRSTPDPDAPRFGSAGWGSRPHRPAASVTGRRRENSGGQRENRARKARRRGRALTGVSGDLLTSNRPTRPPADGARTPEIPAATATVRPAREAPGARRPRRPRRPRHRPRRADRRRPPRRRRSTARRAPRSAGNRGRARATRSRPTAPG